LIAASASGASTVPIRSPFLQRTVIRHSRSGFLGDGISSSTTSIRVERLKVAADRLQLFRRQLASVKDRLSSHGVTLIAYSSTAAAARIALDQNP
jgi:hypothetical protein